MSEAILAHHNNDAIDPQDGRRAISAVAVPSL
jgi:hypothetical protein